MKIASGTSLLLTLFCFAKPYDCLADTCSVRNTFLETCPKFDIGDYAKNTIRSVILEQQSVERETRMVNVRARVGTERLVNNRRIVDSDSRISNFPAKSANNDRANNIINRDFRRSTFTDRSRVVNDNRIRESVGRDSNTRSYLTRDSRREISYNARMLTTRNKYSPNEGDIKRIVDTIRNIRESNADLESRIVDVRRTFDNRRAFREGNSDRESRIGDSRHTFDNQRERRELTVDRESRVDDTQRAIRQSTVDRETRTVDRRNTVDNRRGVREFESDRKSRVVDARRNSDNRRALRESNSDRETRSVDARRTLDNRRTLHESSTDRESHTNDIRSTANNQRVVRESSSNPESRIVDTRRIFDNRRALGESNVDRESRLFDIRSSTDNRGSHSKANSERETRNVDARRILDNQRAARKLGSERESRMVDTFDNRIALHESVDREFRTVDKTRTVDNRRTADRESRIVDITRTYDNRRALPESTTDREFRIVDRRTTVDNRRAIRESTAERESRIVDTTRAFGKRRALPESTNDREFRIVDRRTTVDNQRAIRESTTEREPRIVDRRTTVDNRRAIRESTADRASRIVDTTRAFGKQRALPESTNDREFRIVDRRTTVDNRRAIRESTTEREPRIVDRRTTVDNRRAIRESTADRASRIVDTTRAFDNRRALPESTTDREFRNVDRRTTIENGRAIRESTADRESRIVDTTPINDNRRALPESTTVREFRNEDKRTTVDNRRAIRESTADRESRIAVDNRRAVRESTPDRESRIVDTRRTYDNRKALSESTIDRKFRTGGSRSVERVEIRLNNRELPTNRVATKIIRKIDSFTDVTRDSRELPSQARSAERDRRFRTIDRTTSSTRNLQAGNINLKDTDRKTVDRIPIQNIKPVSNEGLRESITERITMERNSQKPIQERHVTARDSRFVRSRQPEIKNFGGRTENKDRRDQRSTFEVRESRNSVDNRRVSDRTGQLYQRFAGSTRIAEEISNKGFRKADNFAERLLTDVRLAERVRERVQTTARTFKRSKTAEVVRDAEGRSREVSRRDSRIRDTLFDLSSGRALQENSATRKQIREDRTERVNDGLRILERRTAITNRKSTETSGRQARTSTRYQVDDRRVVDRNLQHIASRTGRMSSDDSRFRAPVFNDYLSTKDENNNERLQVNERHSNFHNYNDMMGKKTIGYTTWSNIVTTVLSVLLFAHMIGTSADFKKYQYFTSYFTIAKEKIF